MHPVWSGCLDVAFSNADVCKSSWKLPKENTVIYKIEYSGNVKKDQGDIRRGRFVSGGDYLRLCFPLLFKFLNVQLEPEDDKKIKRNGGLK